MSDFQRSSGQVTFPKRLEVFILKTSPRTSLKTNMEQTTLTNLLPVKNASTTNKVFNPDPAIEHWLFSAKTKRHGLS